MSFSSSAEIRLRDPFSVVDTCPNGWFDKTDDDVADDLFGAIRLKKRLRRMK